MVQRIAENLCWMARDMKRAEPTAPMLDGSFRMAPLPSNFDQALHLQPILAIAPGDLREIMLAIADNVRLPPGRDACA